MGLCMWFFDLVCIGRVGMMGCVSGWVLLGGAGRYGMAVDGIAVVLLVQLGEELLAGDSAEGVAAGGVMTGGTC